jgi:hypothetical protein
MPMAYFRQGIISAVQQTIVVKILLTVYLSSFLPPHKIPPTGFESSPFDVSPDESVSIQYGHPFYVPRRCQFPFCDVNDFVPGWNTPAASNVWSPLTNPFISFFLLVISDENTGGHMLGMDNVLILSKDLVLLLMF